MATYTIEIQTGILTEEHVIHQWVLITRPDGTQEAWGYYPEDRNSASNMISGPGMVYSESLIQETTSSSGPMEMTEVEYANFTAYREYFDSHPQEYSLVGDQCAKWTIGAMLANKGVDPSIAWLIAGQLPNSVNPATFAEIFAGIDLAQLTFEQATNFIEYLQSQPITNPSAWDDINGNGLLNENDPDMDGDWILNERDPDMDGDGILNEHDEHAQDRRTLNDIDGDGRANEDDNDIDGDGAKNYEDEDIDNDGQKNDVDPNDFDPRTPDDIDGDGIKDWNDLDRDGDGILNEKDDHPDDIEDQPRGNPYSIDPGAWGITPIPPPPPPQGAKDALPNSTYNGSPIILDLDGDGVETTGLKAGAYFDHGGDGFAEQTGWAGKDDGLLVMDRNNNGLIDTGAELFGDSTPLADDQKAANGFAALAELDSNQDGLVDASAADNTFNQRSKNRKRRRRMWRAGPHEPFRPGERVSGRKMRWNIDPTRFPTQAGELLTRH